MKIDFSKLVVLLLPTPLRRIKTALLIEACIQPAALMYDNMLSWGEQKKLELATNWQVMYLEAYINYMLTGSYNSGIKIADSDGITSDFKLVIPHSVPVPDDSLIKACLDKYKLIGKRYEIVNGSISYSAVWNNLLSKHEIRLETATWNNFISKYENRRIDVSIAHFAWSAWKYAYNSGWMYWYVILTANNVGMSGITSNINITFTIGYITSKSNGVTIYETKTVTMPSGSIQFRYNGTAILTGWDEASQSNGYISIQSFVIQNISPASDSNYNYKA